MKSDVLYGDLAEWYDRLYYSKERTAKEINFINKLLIKHKCKKLLEISAGSGRLTIPLKKLGHDIVGVDISKEMIALAKIKAKKEGLKIPFFVQSMEKTNVPGKPFDCVMLPCSSPLYLTDNGFAIETLKRCNAHLKKGGILFFDVQNFWRIILSGRIIKKEPAMSGGNWKMSLLHNYVISQIKGELRDDQTLICYIGKKKLPPVKRDILFRIYNLNEIDLLFRLTGFKIVEAYSDYKFHKLSEENNKRYILIAKKI